MPTNRKRKSRLSKRIPINITPEYIRHLHLMDFGGWLTEEEIPVAKKLNIYKWDGWKKEERCQRRAAEHHEGE
jgi:hypothetical protein